jgi:hypothetical protein
MPKNPSSHGEALLGMSQDGKRLLFGNPWEPLQKFVHTGAFLEILEEGSHRNSRAFEDP